MKPQELKQLLRDKGDGMEQNHATRLHRAISWLLCAEKYAEDDDITFINLWISFNSCYSIDENTEALGDRATFRQFIEHICAHDHHKRIYNLLWMNYSGFVRAIINNQFLFAPFWDSHYNGDTKWHTLFEHNQSSAMYALANQQVSQLLSLVLDRLYVLRNQMIHGGATYNSKINREQLKNSCRLLTELMPIIIEVMLDEIETQWGKIRYPVINSLP